MRMQELVSIAARVLINQSIRACDYNGLLSRSFKVSPNESVPLSQKCAAECLENVEDCTFKEEITRESNI